MIVRAATAGAALIAGLLAASAGAAAQSAAGGNAQPQSPELQVPQQQPAPPPGMFFWPTRPAPEPAPQQNEDGQGCTYRENKLELIT